MAKNGAGFGGFATYLDMTPADSDMLAIPDPDSLIQLPWKDQGKIYAKKLIAAGNDVKQYYFSDLPHSFLILGRISRSARNACKILAEDLADYFK